MNQELKIKILIKANKEDNCRFISLLLASNLIACNISAVLDLFALIFSGRKLGTPKDLF